MSVESIIAEIEQLNVLDLVQLTKTLQEKWGVSAAPVAAAAAPAAAEAAPAAAPGKFMSRCREKMSKERKHLDPKQKRKPPNEKGGLAARLSAAALLR